MSMAMAKAVKSVVSPEKRPDWQHRLSDIFWINSVAISDDGSRVVAATFIHDYKQKTGKFAPNVQSRFGTHCFDGQAQNKLLWSDGYDGWDGIFGVAISGDGQVAAAGGWLGKSGDTVRGLVRAYSAADGTRLLDYTEVNQRVNGVALSKDGSVLVAAADDIYVFLRKDGAFDPVPLKADFGEVSNRYVTAVAVHPSGKWLAACDQIGHVYMATIRKDALQGKQVWPVAQGQPEIPFLSVAIAKNSETFAVGGGNSVYVLDAGAIRKGQNPPALEYAFDTTDPEVPPAKDSGKPQENVRWVAISADGKLVTAVANRLGVGKSAGKGLLVALTPRGGKLALAWSQTLENGPNSTSIDAEAKYVSASDGYPTGKPAKFYLFDPKDGSKIWDFVTYSMNWPMVISSDGKAIAAGSDDGTVYYFKP